MGYDSPNTTVIFEAGAAVTKGQIVKLSAGKVIPCSVAGEAFTGVALDSVALGKDVEVCIAGECDVLTADTSAVMVEVMTDASGRAIAKTSTNAIVGLLLEPGLAPSGSIAAPSRILVRGKLSV
jgi:hypothetical protein